MIERPNVDSLMAGPLGDWLARQTLVRVAAKNKSNNRFVISAFVVLPLLAFATAVKSPSVVVSDSCTSSSILFVPDKVSAESPR